MGGSGLPPDLNQTRDLILLNTLRLLEKIKILGFYLLEARRELLNNLRAGKREQLRNVTVSLSATGVPLCLPRAAEMNCSVSIENS
jgi:hypothetical protein